MYRFIEKYTSIKSFVVTFILAMLVYGIMMILTIPHLIELMQGTSIFDLKPLGYSVKEGHHILSQMSQEARLYYQEVQLPLDFIYPGLLALYGMMLTVLLSNKTAYDKYLVYFPFLAGVFDYLENLGIYRMLSGHNSDMVISLTSTFGILKSLNTTVFFSVVLVLLLIKVKKKFTNPTITSTSK